jgi:hypothetical protein
MTVGPSELLFAGAEERERVDQCPIPPPLSELDRLAVIVVVIECPTMFVMFA